MIGEASEEGFDEFGDVRRDFETEGDGGRGEADEPTVPTVEGLSGVGEEVNEIVYDLIYAGCIALVVAVSDEAAGGDVRGVIRYGRLMSVPFQVECGCFAFLVELVVETACDGWV